MWKLYKSFVLKTLMYTLLNLCQDIAESALCLPKKNIICKFVLTFSQIYEFSSSYGPENGHFIKILEATPRVAKCHGFFLVRYIGSFGVKVRENMQNLPKSRLFWARFVQWMKDSCSTKVSILLVSFNLSAKAVAIYAFSLGWNLVWWFCSM